MQERIISWYLDKIDWDMAVLRPKNWTQNSRFLVNNLPCALLD
jgi:hypothetical protein